jgi:glycerophosphoryl diester phosphodiesterase
MFFFMLRFWGLSQRYQAFEHNFTNAPAVQLAVKIQSEKDADEALATDPSIIFWLDVRMSLDHQLFVQTKGLLEPFLSFEKQGPARFHGEKPYFYSLADLKVYFPELLELKSFLQTYPQQKMILNIQDNATDIHLALVQLITENKAEQRVLIQSDIDIILKVMKEEKPTWLFGTSLPELTRVLTLESVGLEMTPSIRADVWVTPSKLKDRSVFKESIVSELQRRHKKVFLSGINSREQFLDAERYKLDGLIFEKVETLKDFLSTVKRP